VDLAGTTNLHPSRLSLIAMLRSGWCAERPRFVAERITWPKRDHTCSQACRLQSSLTKTCRPKLWSRKVLQRTRLHCQHTNRWCDRFQQVLGSRCSSSKRTMTSFTLRSILCACRLLGLSGCLMVLQLVSLLGWRVQILRDSAKFLCWLPHLPDPHSQPSWLS